jgi:hypothetical protein
MKKRYRKPTLTKAGALSRVTAASFVEMEPAAEEEAAQ